MMKKAPLFNRLPWASLLILLVLLSLIGCQSDANQEVQPLTALEITNFDRGQLEVGSTMQLKTDAPEDYQDQLEWSSSSDAVTVDQSGKVTAVSVGKATITVRWNDLSDKVLIDVVEYDPTMPDSAEREEFYGDYEPAQSNDEAAERSRQGLLSGSITVPDQAPVIAEFRPSVSGKLIRNNQPYFLDDDTYVVVNAYGQEVLRIYRAGGYITLEEVAAYLYAFGDVPANYVTGKKTNPNDSIWGEYLRLNHSKFSGDTKKYPYEPALPDISGCGGSLQYYEVDIGTTGTDCDPGYDVAIYNDGVRIVRGAARIVYSRYDANHNSIIDPNEKYLFYTYNHYNDFQEYLNYFHGWGDLFGNVTGGGTLSSKYDCNPTPYIESVLSALPPRAKVIDVICILPDRKYDWMAA